jgi:uncharacterized protein
MTEKGFSLRDNKYYYCSTTNELMNAGLKKTYSKFVKEREVKVADVNVDENIVRSQLVNLNQLTFEVTQNCNLKCAYCTYESGAYVHFRPGSSKSLKFDTAKKSIDLIWGIINQRDKKKFTIGFYGGEPLLHFPLIEQIVDYSRKIFYGWELSYSITTNGTLLNDRIINFFIENLFYTSISLDGPAENTDAKRVFRNGGGTFRTVIENLKRIKTINGEFYENNVSFSIVYSKDLSFEKVFKFFNEANLVKNNNHKLVFVVESGSNYYNKYPYDGAKFQKDFEKAFKSIVRKKRDKKDLSSLESRILATFGIYSDHLGNKRYNSLMGTCFYDNRLYVDADGGFHICEKINDKFQFGSAHSGFDYSKMAALTAQYLEKLKKCRQCEVKYLCQKCYINLAENGTFELNEDFCTNARRKIKRLLEDVIRMEEGGTAL